MSSKENLIPEDLAIIELSGLLTAWQTPESDKSRGLDPYLSEHYSSLVKLIPQLEAMLRQIAILAQRDDIGRSAVASEYPQIRLSVLSIVNILATLPPAHPLAVEVARWQNLQLTIEEYFNQFVTIFRSTSHIASFEEGASSSIPNFPRDSVLSITQQCLLSAHRIKLYLHDASEVIDGGVQRLRLAQSRLEYATVGEHLAQSIDQQLRLAATTLEPILQLVGIRTTDTNKRIWYREYIPLHAEFYTVTDKLIDQLRFVAQYIPETSQFAEYCQQIQRSVLQLRRALNSVFIDHRTSSKRDRNRKTFAKSDFLTIAQDPIADFLSFVNGNITKFEAPPSSDGATSNPDYLRERAEQVDLLEKYLDGLIGQCLADFDALTAFMQSKQSQPSADCGGANGGGCVKYLEISELVDRVLASFTDLENTFKLVSGARLTLNNANFNSTIHQLLTKAIDELKQCTDNQRNKKGYPSLRIKNYFDAVGPSMNEVKQALLDHAASKLSTVVATSAMADKPTDTALPAENPT